MGVGVSDFIGEVLLNLLEAPDDVDAWIRKQTTDLDRLADFGSFEEQVRHWWSNECPHFVAEQLCHSQPTALRVGERDAEFDGTMRVGFALHSRPQGEAGAGGTGSRPEQAT